MTPRIVAHTFFCLVHSKLSGPCLAHPSVHTFPHYMYVPSQVGWHRESLLATPPEATHPSIYTIPRPGCLLPHLSIHRRLTYKEHTSTHAHTLLFTRRNVRPFTGGMAPRILAGHASRGPPRRLLAAPHHFATRRPTPPQRCVRGPFAAASQSFRHPSRRVSFVIGILQYSS